MAASKNDRQAKIAAAAPRSSGANNRLIAILVGVVVVAAVVVAVILGTRSNEAPTPAGPGTGGTTAAVKLPKGATDVKSGVVANPGVAKAGAPTLKVFEDFQCPACKSVENVLGPTIREMATKGDITLVYYVKTFLDDNLRNDSSKKAGLAALCAADQGKLMEMHDALYKAQPANEGDGYSDAAINGAAAEAGLTGAALTDWQKCLADKPYLPYLAAVEDVTAREFKIASTPSFYVNNKIIDMKTVTDAADFKKKVLAG